MISKVTVKGQGHHGQKCQNSNCQPSIKKGGPRSRSRGPRSRAQRSMSRSKCNFSIFNILSGVKVVKMGGSDSLITIPTPLYNKAKANYTLNKELVKVCHVGIKT